MDVPNGTAKGKGKGKAREKGGTLVPRPGETTPTPGPRLDPDVISKDAVGLPGASLIAFCAKPIKMPRPTQVGILALCVSLLALGKGLLLPAPAVVRPPALSEEQEDILIRLVLTQELGAIIKRIETENGDLEDLLTMQARALDEVKDMEEGLAASTMEIEELETLSRTVHEGNTADAGLTTQVARAQDNLRDMHRAMSTTLDEARRQLESQEESIMLVRRELQTVARRARDVRQQTGAAMDKETEADTMDLLREFEEAHSEVTNLLNKTRRSVVSDSQLEALFVEAARAPLDADDHHDPDDQLDTVRHIARATVERGLAQGYAGEDSSVQSARGGEQCLSEQDFHGELETAIRKLDADGTGLRDFANAAIGGRIVTTKDVTSNTYTPSSWWGPSWYWHRIGLENGIGPVESTISDDSSLGACWAMEGSTGRITIELPVGVTVESVSLEHVSRLVTLEGYSAPALFEVYGLRDERDKRPLHLGEGMYDIDGRPIQTFRVRSLGRSFRFIQFRILSNWGNPDYTCIYRLRVHGRKAG